jgi:hypothetical protein
VTLRADQYVIDRNGPDMAAFSPDRVYRYSLWRQVVEPHDNLPWVAFIGLNPSTADAFQNDPTVRRCMGFAERWGYGRMCMLNLFAYRATDPRIMRAQDDPIGDANDQFLRGVCAGVEAIVMCWGAHGAYRGRASQVREMLREMEKVGTLYHLGKTQGGQPKHPLYLSNATVRQVAR